MDWMSLMAGSSGGSHQTGSGGPTGSQFGNVTFGNASGGMSDQQMMLMVGAGLLALFLLTR